MLIDLGATYEQFLEAAKYGLVSSEKKYFEQIIACDNYMYFKNLMVKRNLLLQKEAYEMMYSHINIPEEISNSFINKGIINFIKRQKLSKTSKRKGRKGYSSSYSNVISFGSILIILM